MKKLLVVCAGNSFRSAVAEALFRKQLKEVGLDARIEGCGVVPEILEGKMKVSDYAVRLMDERDIDVSGHTPRHMSQVDLRSFDKIFTMDSGLRDKLLEAGAQREKIRVLNAEDGEVPDTWPHGKEKEHRDCVDLLERTIAAEVRGLWNAAQ